MSDQKFYNDYYKTLEGAQIIKSTVKEDEDGLWPTLTIKTPSGKQFELEISQDEEGNGPGFIFGLPT